MRESMVMSLSGFLGRRKNLLEENADQYALLRLSHPVLRKEDILKLQYSEKEQVKSVVLDMLFDISEIDPYHLKLEDRKSVV